MQAGLRQAEFRRGRHPQTSRSCRRLPGRVGKPAACAPTAATTGEFVSRHGVTARSAVLRVRGRIPSHFRGRNPHGVHADEHVCGRRVRAQEARARPAKVHSWSHSGKRLSWYFLVEMGRTAAGDRRAPLAQGKYRCRRHGKTQLRRGGRLAGQQRPLASLNHGCGLRRYPYVTRKSTYNILVLIVLIKKRLRFQYV